MLEAFASPVAAALDQPVIAGNNSKSEVVSASTMDIALVEAVGRSRDDLDILPRHRLLLKPHGFEGLVVGPKVIESCDLALANRVDARHLDVQIGPAAPPTPDEPHDHAIPRVKKIGDGFQLCRRATFRAVAAPGARPPRDQRKAPARASRGSGARSRRARESCPRCPYRLRSTRQCPPWTTCTFSSDTAYPRSSASRSAAARASSMSL